MSLAARDNMMPILLGVLYCAKTIDAFPVVTRVARMRISQGSPCAQTSCQLAYPIVVFNDQVSASKKNETSKQGYCD